MRLYLAVILMSLVILTSCGTKNNISNFLDETHLEQQFFNINTHRDTILLTKNGCVISIQKESIESDSDHIKLEIREALTPTDIVLAGLTTASGGKPLKSGGMIYFNAASGYDIKIKKEIKIQLPTKTYNPAMQVFKGVKDAGKIDWIDPAPLPKDETQEKIGIGEALFKSSCANCHKIYEDFTGPALYGITERKPKEWLYDYTRNAMKRVYREGYTGEAIYKSDSSHTPIMPDFYASCLFRKWGKTTMSAFPALSDKDLDALYAYIKTESDKRPDLKYRIGKTCCDSCADFSEKLYSASLKRDLFSRENDEFFNLDITLPGIQAAIPASPTVSSGAIEPTPDLVSVNKTTGTYYTINITATGWYNIDVLLKGDPACQESELFVRMQGSYKVDVNVVLVIPSWKVFIEGGKLPGGDQYGFYETNGKITLPQNESCYVMAFGEYKDKLVFGRTAFTSSLKQTIDIKLTETTRQEMQASIKALKLDDVNPDIRDSKHANKIRDIDRNLDSIMRYRPKNCDCDDLLK